ncbi:PREDICTED: 1-acyl-sn-glycerol-3-phosphate acyltransferase delta-like [Amphimedon queenslandica]|nr:PREDICTED: 1-acyl-sn-glycerol-3-phosphate acyltransferase delta-like [Amphimedon queenslandica]|eukprot:XP_019858571.1 PREDICTED: 1-acyl-sn-glycerol-3-phosphate acyltransferase delta-like [Amphimedon queenslandica]
MDQLPCACDIAVRRIPMSEVPIGSDEECAKWLTNLYKEKDDLVDHHIKHKVFPSPYHEIQVPTRPWPNVVMSIWILFVGLPILSLASYLLYVGAWYTLVGVVSSLIIVNQLFYFIIKMTEVRYGSDHGLKKKADSIKNKEEDTKETFKNHKKEK